MHPEKPVNMSTLNLNNHALNLEAFAVRSGSPAPPALNALYLRDGTYDNMTRADVAATFAAFRAQNQTKRLALFFHGGLVDKASGQQGAANEFTAYTGHAFPLFFIWESGFGEVLAHHLPLIFAETVFGRLLTHATDVIAPKLTAPQAGMNAVQAINTVPVTLSSDEIDTFLEAVKSDPIVQHEAVAIARSSQDANAILTQSVTTQTMVLSQRTQMSPEIVSAVRGAFVQASSPVGAGTTTVTVQAIPFTGAGALQAAFSIAKAAVPVLLNTIKRFARGRDHGLTCTLVEELLRALYAANFGSAMWEEMKKETEDAFSPDSSKFGGTAVIEELCQLVKDKADTRITLVGHSTGGVYIGNFLTHVDQALTAQGDATTKFDVILLAPANTNDFFANKYVPGRVSGIRIFQMRDSVEQQDHLLTKDVGPGDPSILGKVYPRSLLYLVAGVCESFEGQGGSGKHALDAFDMPILGMDRYYENNRVFTAADYPSVGLLRTEFPVPAAGPAFARVLSPTNLATAPLGFRCTAMKHGNFPGDEFTIESLKECFDHGLSPSV